MSAIPNIHAALDTWHAHTRRSGTPEDELDYRSFGHARAVLENESGYLVLCRIETDPAHRGEGQASALIELLKTICDDHGVTLLGQATAYEETGLDQQTLLAWYGRHGFEIDRERTEQPLVWYPARPGH